MGMGAESRSPKECLCSDPQPNRQTPAHGRGDFGQVTVKGLERAG